MVHCVGRLLGSLGTTTPPAAGSRAPLVDGGGGSATSVDASMVVILAALLCAVILALGLNSIVRCALRCGRRLAFETPERAGQRRGLSKRALRRLPLAVYGAGADVPAAECPICLDEFSDGEKVRVLPKCRHGFHVGCLDRWLASRSTCPTCRRSLLDGGAADKVDMENPSDHRREGEEMAAGVHVELTLA